MEVGDEDNKVDDADDVEQKEEDQIIEPQDQMTILEAEAARDEIQRIPL